MPTPGPELDAARRLAVERNVVRAAFEHLTRDAFLALPFEALGPTKTLLKRFFSGEPWGEEEINALAEVVGPGEGRWERELDPHLTLAYGWADGRFQVTLISRATDQPPVPDSPSSFDDGALAASFDGPVAPEATPNPRTIRFQVGPIPSGRQRWYESKGVVQDDPGVARLFSEFEEVANVLVGPDFVAVSLRRPADWERLLLPVLSLIAEEVSSDPDGDAQVAGEPRVIGGPAAMTGERARQGSARRRTSRLDEAWRQLGALRPAQANDLERVLAEVQGDDQFRRQVAANLLREAPPAAAATAWSRLVEDPVRSVRRATVDAMVDAGREELRPLLERALSDTDAWIRWKALRGLVELGPAPSRDHIAALAADADFRVRLEVAAALREP
ncbi:MAG: HEAT repeat domain-containing protein [Actinomycetota bacterium]|nr:HEAT repeat domain-containing protein [Actinomycetota bacterium]